MVDLHVVAGGLAALERDRSAGVEVRQGAGGDVAPVGGQLLTVQVANEDLLSRVLAVAVGVGVGVGPAGTERIAAVGRDLAGRWRPGRPASRVSDRAVRRVVDQLLPVRGDGTCDQKKIKKP
jgi:hypothetical protein